MLVRRNLGAGAMAKGTESPWASRYLENFSLGLGACSFTRRSLIDSEGHED